MKSQSVITSGLFKQAWLGVGILDIDSYYLFRDSLIQGDQILACSCFAMWRTITTPI